MKNKGITLIALVVTIVVLLILAGVSISLLAGDNGIIKKSEESKEKTIIGEEIEFINMAKSYAYTMQNDDKPYIEHIRDELNNNPGKDKTKVYQDGDFIIVEYKETGHIYQIDDQGNVEEYIKYIDETPGKLAGTGTEEDPYRLESIEDLVAFSIMTNGGNTALGLENKNFKNEYLILSRTLDFNRDNCYCDPNTTIYNSYLGENDNSKGLKELLTKETGFKPIGTFNGSYNGDNKEIANIYINITKSQGYAFIRKLEGTIQNLTISGNIIKSNTNINNITVAGLICEGTNSKIENCVNAVSMNLKGGDLLIGGIAGKVTNTEVYNCLNKGEIKYTSTGTVAGIAGTANNSKILKCSNIGTIEVANKAGGIVGWNENYNEIRNCNNSALITGGEGVGGIAATENSYSKIIACYNSGDISGTTKVGGICGYIWQENGQPEMLNSCYNTGKVIGTEIVGGIVGMASDQQIRYCYNTGSISANKIVGGIVGQLVWGEQYFIVGLIEGCYNLGVVNATSSTIKNLGILGHLKNGTIKNCYYYQDGKVLGYTNYTHMDSDGTKEIETDYEKENSQQSDLYSEKFLQETLGFKKFISESDVEENYSNVWKFNNKDNPKLWWESK